MYDPVMRQALFPEPGEGLCSFTDRSAVTGDLPASENPDIGASQIPEGGRFYGQSVQIRGIYAAIAALIDVTSDDSQILAAPDIDTQNTTAVEPAAFDADIPAVSEIQDASHALPRFHRMAGGKTPERQIVAETEGEDIGVPGNRRDRGGALNGQIVRLRDHQLGAVIGFLPEVTAATCVDVAGAEIQQITVQDDFRVRPPAGIPPRC